MTTQYAARHVAPGGEDPEPEGLASSWGDHPAPRRALLPEDAATGYVTYEVEPELVPYAAVASEALPVQRTSPSEFGPPVVALAPSRTMAWHLASASRAPEDPGPLDATPPVTFGADPASIPTPVSQSTAFAYQSMPSPSPHTSALSPAPYDAASARGSLVRRPQTVEQALELVLPPAAGTAVKVVVSVQRAFSLTFVLAIVGIFTAVGFSQGGSNTWFIVGFAWLVGILMVVGILSPGRGRLRWSVLK
jgi:hypothetical protein